MFSVSVVIPCYNVQDYIDECIKSVLLQGEVVKEVICVDNNSTDETRKKLEHWASKDYRIQVLFESKPGASAARNCGLRKCSAEWIQFLDADDILMAGKLTHQVSLINQHVESVDFVAGASFRRAANGQEKMILPMIDPWKAVFTTSFGITSANVWKREVTDKLGGWNENLNSSQESDLMFRLLKNGFNQVLIDDRPLTIVRERAHGQISKTNISENLDRYASLRLTIVDYLISHETRYWFKEKSFFIDHLLILAERLLAAGNEGKSRSIVQTVKNKISLFDFRSQAKLMRLLLRLKFDSRS